VWAWPTRERKAGKRKRKEVTRLGKRWASGKGLKAPGLEGEAEKVRGRERLGL